MSRKTYAVKAADLKYITSDLYGQHRVITFEHNGEQDQRNLTTLEDSDYTYRGTFQYLGKTFLLYKHMELENNATVLVIEIKEVDANA